MASYESKFQSEELDSLFETILKLDSISECYRYFEDLCTIPELHSLAQRWLVARELHQGTTYEDISKSTKASTATISRVNRSLTYGSGGYSMMLDRMSKDK